MYEMLYIHVYVLCMCFGVSLLSHVSNNSSDVIVISSGHADTERKGKYNGNINRIEHSEIVPTTTKPKTTTVRENNEDEDVVFVPNVQKEVRRNFQYNGNHYDEPMHIHDLMESKKTVGELMREADSRVDRKIYGRVTTEPPPDILFITGKNNDGVKEQRKQKARYNDIDDPIKRSETRRKPIRSEPISCPITQCNNTVDSVCGGKQERKQWKYRLFLNDCYLRKVNCEFKYEHNRYELVDSLLCAKVGGHYTQTKQQYQMQAKMPESMTRRTNIRRSGDSKSDQTQPTAKPPAPISRRSLQTNMNGVPCGHVCPLRCTEDYDPECAMNTKGERRVFLNHCKLDYNSCVYKIAWRRRPMAECVGGRKADMYQNRAFINWMQGAGIVDNKGRLKLE